MSPMAVANGLGRNIIGQTSTFDLRHIRSVVRPTKSFAR